MKKRLLGAMTFVACTPAQVDVDAGRSDAGHTSDAGCPCFTDAGVCKVPGDFPATEPSYVQDAICECRPNNSSVFCFFETSARCVDWACRPGKEQDGGLSTLPDGGVECLCFA